MSYRRLVLLIAITACVGCAQERTPAHIVDDTHDGHDQHPVTILKQTRLTQGPLDDGQMHVIEQVKPFQHVGLYLDGDQPSSLQWRAQALNGQWTSWQVVPLTWSEGRYHVGRVLLIEPTTTIAFRGGQGVEHASVEFYPTLPAQPARLARDMPRVTTTPSIEQRGTLRTRSSAIAPESLVVSRAKWGARDPGKVCGSVVAPYRMSIHHTAQPDSDGGDPAARMRQMQAFHMDNRGWCDIGYHFVVSQSGNVYQGRSDERRPGAHVGNQNAGNVGISFIGNYESTNPPQAQLDAAVRIMAWIKQTYNITWDRDHVKGHRQWPGQSTGCPGAQLLAQIDELMAQVENPKPKTYDVDISVNMLGESLKSHHTQGSSQSIDDVFVGDDKLQAEILITNKNDEAIRGVEVAYLIEQPYLSATNYVIQTDWPAKDGATWMLNDANDSPNNPAKDQMGKAGVLDMNAFGAGETKRILIDLSATQYSLGAIDHPDVRGWVKRIDGVYEDQTDWDQMPTTNLTGKQLQAFDQVDVLARDQWQWDVPEEADTEGWSSCGDTTLSRNIEGGALMLTQTGEDPCVTSPSWTSVDARAWPQMAMRLKSPAGAHTYTITWKNAEDTYAAHFDYESDGQSKTLVVDLSDQTGWTGDVSSLSLSIGAPSTTHELDALYFQNADDNKTNTPIETVIIGESIRVTPGTPSGQPPKEPVVPNDPKAPKVQDDQEEISVNGCSSTGGAPTSSLLWIVAMAFGMCLRRRKAAKRS